MLLSIFVFFGRLHPVLVHLPIGILLVGLFLQVLSRSPTYGISQGVIKIVLLCGFFSALASCITGYCLSLDGEYDESLVSWHMWMGICVALASLLLFLAVAKKKTGRMYQVGCVALLALIFITGHLGGSLTHGPDYLTAALNSGSDAATVRKPIPDIKEAQVYGDVIQPMLQSHCDGCHGASKQKGKLRLDDSAWITKGGKDGPVIKPFHPEGSLLVKRILLPEEDEHRMPPMGKTPLTESELALFRWWIGQGAGFHGKVKDLPQPGKIADYLLALQIGNDRPGGRNDMVPSTPVDPASPKDLDTLRARKIAVIPVAVGSPYLSVNFVNAADITDKDLALLLPLRKQLVWLKLGSQPVGDSGMSFVGQCTALTVLHLNNTRITDKGLVYLRSLAQLRLLNLVGTAVTAQGVISLDSLHLLQSVFLYRTKLNSKDWMLVKQHFPKTILDSGGYAVPFAAWDTVNERRGVKKK